MDGSNARRVPAAGELTVVNETNAAFTPNPFPLGRGKS